MNAELSSNNEFFNINFRLNELETKLSNLYSHLSSKSINYADPFIRSNEEKLNAESKINGSSNFGVYSTAKLLNLIDSELNQRFRPKNQVVILGLKNSGNDFLKLKQLFKLLGQIFQTKFTRIRTENRNSDFPEPIICELFNEFDVKKLVECSFKLKRIKILENVYINPHLTWYQRQLGSLKRKEMKCKQDLPNQENNINKSSKSHQTRVTPSSNLSNLP
ncbi:unnamed protein product, partial [Brachionus calyciflorus]